jgi:hypothetical protein
MPPELTAVQAPMPGAWLSSLLSGAGKPGSLSAPMVLPAPYPYAPALPILRSRIASVRGALERADL